MIIGSFPMNYYYLDAQSREIGPVPIDALRALRAAGSLTDATLVRPEAGGPWSALSTMIGVTPPPASASASPSPALQAVSAGIADARAALSHLVVNPAAGLPAAWQSLGPKRAVAAGVTLLAGTAVLFLLLVFASSSFAWIRPTDFSTFLKLTLAIAGALATWVITLIGTQRIFSSASHYGGCVLTAGSLSILWAVGLLAYVLLGFGNIEALAVIAVAIVCINVLQLYVGLTKVLAVGDQAATWSIPVIVIACIWFTKIIFVAIYPVFNNLRGLVPGFGG